MRKAMAASMLAAGFLATSVTAASAWDDRYDGYRDHRGPGPVLGFAGDVLAGAVKVATFPLALLADIGRDGHPHYFGPDRPRDYVEEGAYVASQQQARDYYGANARYYGPPPGFYSYYGR